MTFKPCRTDSYVYSHSPVHPSMCYHYCVLESIPLERCSQGCHRMFQLSAAHICSPCTSQSRQSCSGPHGPAARCLASNHCKISESTFTSYLGTSVCVCMYCTCMCNLCTRPSFVLSLICRRILLTGRLSPLSVGTAVHPGFQPHRTCNNNTVYCTEMVAN